MADKNLLSSEKQIVPQPIIQPITPTTIPAGTVRQRHLQANTWVIKTGLAVDRPTDGTSSKFYFATDTFVLSYYDTVSKTWKSGNAFS